MAKARWLPRRRFDRRLTAIRERAAWPPPLILCQPPPDAAGLVDLAADIACILGLERTIGTDRLVRACRFFLSQPAAAAADRALQAAAPPGDTP